MHSLFCTRGRFSYKPITLIKGQSECPAYYTIIAPGQFDSRKIACRTVKSAGIWLGSGRKVKPGLKAFRHLYAGGGLYYSGNDLGLLVPASAGDYWRVIEDAQEGDVTNARVVISGLARIHAGFAEEHIGLYFEPIDPKAVGLTWKFDNTVDAEHRGGNGAKVVTLDTR